MIAAGARCDSATTPPPRRTSNASYSAADHVREIPPNVDDTMCPADELPPTPARAGVTLSENSRIKA